MLFIIGLLAGVAIVSMPGDERALRVEAERFAARTIAARDEAVTGSSPVSVIVSAAGYYFERRIDGRWEPLSAGQRLTGWDKGTSVTQDGALLSNRPQSGTVPQPETQGRARIVFDSVGLASSDATVRLARGRASLAVRIFRNGKVQVDAAP